MPQASLPDAVILEMHMYVSELKKSFPGAGVFAFEFLVVPKYVDGNTKYEVTLCEISPRIHNSGHGTNLGQKQDLLGVSQELAALTMIAPNSMSTLSIFPSISIPDVGLSKTLYLDKPHHPIITTTVLKQPIAMINLLCQPPQANLVDSLYQATLNINEQEIRSHSDYGTFWEIVSIRDYGKNNPRTELKISNGKHGDLAIVFDPTITDKAYIEGIIEFVKQHIYFEASAVES